MYGFDEKFLVFESKILPIEEEGIDREVWENHRLTGCDGGNHASIYLYIKNGPGEGAFGGFIRYKEEIVGPCDGSCKSKDAEEAFSPSFRI